MKKSFKKQVLDHNIKKFSLIIQKKTDIFSSIKALTKINKNFAI